MSIKPTILKKAIQETNGKVFGISFIKADGSLRRMTARTGVKKDLKGTKPEATKKRKATLDKEGMIGVYEIGNKNQYRTINLNTVKSFKFQKKKILFV